jgi:hypothetical protein
MHCSDSPLSNSVGLLPVDIGPLLNRQNALFADHDHGAEN